MFFNSWNDLLRIFIVGVPAYLILLVLLRISGKRTLSKMNAFDAVITVAMGSTLATIFLSGDVAFAEGVAALGLLVFLQFMITWTSVRSPVVRRISKADPTLLYYGDEYIEHTLRKERVDRKEVLAALREQGYADLSAVRAVVLETDGSISAVGTDVAPGTESAFEDVELWPEEA